ncbi:hypothetical protein Hdeb2414_s0004g00148621 [Helianthus debilis subsp. tardiflorus]
MREKDKTEKETTIADKPPAATAVVPGFPVTATAVSSRKWLPGCRLLFLLTLAELDGDGR